MTGDLALPAPRLAEGDPLPPEDRLRAAARLAFDDLYRAQAPKLMRFFARRFQRHDAQDLVQESFARLAHAHSDRQEPIDCPEAYLGRIAANLARNRAKSALERSLAFQVPVENVPLPASDLVKALEARDQLNRIQNALVQLPDKTRSIFLAHRLDGLSYREIAKATGLSVKGVEWHMTKALGHLDRALRTR
ncbi:RNA polymerase sigma factor [Sphingomonas psychrotolerans]|uniref:RNA polymerase sigma factor n=1 Tax=Sphingomonas psychrotolerans TaxID=1327635 RepID=UPI001F43F1A1|nr:sigma-70 family RNA polymerase sigma factor [Sphingomonas psychrotolerans]